MTAYEAAFTSMMEPPSSSTDARAPSSSVSENTTEFFAEHTILPCGHGSSRQTTFHLWDVPGEQP